MAMTFAVVSALRGDRWEQFGTNTRYNNIPYIQVTNTESSAKYITSVSVHMAVLKTNYRVKNAYGTYWGNSGSVTLYATAGGKTSDTITISKTITSYDYDAEAGAAIYYAPNSMKSADYKVTLTFSDPVPVSVNSTVEFTFHFSQTTNVLCWEGANSGAYVSGTYSDGQYTVAFNGNSNTGGSMSNQTFTIGVAQNLSSNAFTRTGYTFAGWNTNAAGTGTNYSNGQSVTNLTTTVGGTVTLYAKWTANTYTVTLDKQSGTGGSSSVTATYGSAMPSATMPTRTGYTFGGYYTSTSGGGTQYYTAAGASARTWDIAEARTLYAKWTGNTYTITYNGNNNTGGSTAATSAVYPNARTVASNGFTRTGYTFAGWNTAANGTGTSYAVGSSYSSASNLTLYAQWTINSYTVTYDKNGGSSTPSSQSGNYNSSITLRAAITRSEAESGTTYTVSFNANGHGTAPSALTAKVYTTYAFSSWKSNVDNKTYSGGASYTIPASNTTMTAQWTTGSRTASITLPTISDPNNQYIFKGWSTSSTATSGSTGSYTPSSNVTLYATWAENKFTVTYNSNGGTGTIASVTKLYNETITLPSSGFTKSGCKLIGWNTKADGTGTKYALGRTNYAVTANVTLYAVWYTNFSWTSDDSIYIASNQRISYATADKWNILQNNIKKYVDSSFTVTTASAGSVIEASKIVTAANKLGVSTSGVTKNTVMYPRVFNDLRDQINAQATYLGVS